MVYNLHKKKDSKTGDIKPDKSGCHENHQRISNEDHDGVLKHIESFKVVDPNYCRAETSRQYLESHLNTEKMYDIYLEFCEKSGRVHVKSYHYLIIPYVMSEKIIVVVVVVVITAKYLTTLPISHFIFQRRIAAINENCMM